MIKMKEINKIKNLLQFVRLLAKRLYFYPIANGFTKEKPEGPRIIQSFEFLPDSFFSAL